MSSSDMVNLIKKIAVESVYAAQPDTVVFGKIIKVDPKIEIQINEKLILKEGSKVLIIPKYLKIIDQVMKPPAPAPPPAPYMKPGDQVMLIRTNKGSKYILLDVIGNASANS